jgi:redox-sensitive bicupin YhaK (pirin superfamily)
MKRMSPFVMLDYNSKYTFRPTEKPRGVGVHPHRGFETVTIAYEGSLAHHDSAGNSGVINKGDVQWMTAASGILHKEYHEKEYAKRGGPFQMVQLWVNLRAKDKMTPPKYQELINANMGKYELPDDLGHVEIIAGEYQGAKGPASTFTPVQLQNARLKKGAVVPFSFPAEYNTALIVIEGTVKVNGEDVKTDNFVLFQNSGEEFTVEATEDAVVLVLSGEPIDEPIAAYGPFVMNTEAEIREAIYDLNVGKFGFLED